MSERLKALLNRKDYVDDMFLTYSHPDKIIGNIDTLAKLALIGGRIDTIIRRETTGKRRNG